jgi:hypothetical protein
VQFFGEAGEAGFGQAGPGGAGPVVGGTAATGVCSSSMVCLGTGIACALGFRGCAFTGTGGGGGGLERLPLGVRGRAFTGTVRLGGLRLVLLFRIMVRGLDGGWAHCGCCVEHENGYVWWGGGVGVGGYSYSKTQQV